MDDNELDRLFNETGDSDKESDAGSADISETVDEAASEDEAAKENGFVVSHFDPETSSEDSSEDDGSDDDEDEDVSEYEEEEASDSDESASEEQEEKADDRPKQVKRTAPVNRAPSSKPVSRRMPKEEQPSVTIQSLREAIPLNGKGIAVIGLALAVIIMVILVVFLPAFRVRNAHIEGNVVLSDQEILQEVGLDYDSHLMSGVSGNIFDVLRLDYGKTEKRIMKENPYIEDIRITIKLPSTVDIKIKERRKVCYIRTPDGYAALDKDGIVLELSSFDAKRSVRPVICGLNVISAELGKPVKIGNMNDYKKSIIVLGAILAADNASVGGNYSMFENTSEVRVLPSGYIFLTIYSPSGNLIQIKLNSTETISNDMAWLLYAFNANAFDKVVDGALDMTGDEYIFDEYE